MYRSAQGFTLIELLVVVAVLAIISVVGYLNIGSSQQDQYLKNSASDLVSLLRLAQSNAQSGYKCPSTGQPSSWSVVFTSPSQIDLQCNSVSVKSLTPQRISVSQIACDGTNSSLISGVKDTFSQINGVISFEGSSECTTKNAMAVTLTNEATSKTITVNINKGGSVGIQ